MMKFLLPFLLFLTGCASTEPKLIFAVRPKPAVVPPVSSDTATEAVQTGGTPSTLLEITNSIWFWYALFALAVLFFTWREFGPSIKTWLSKRKNKKTKVLLNEENQ